MDEKARIPTNLRTLLILEVVGSSDAPLSPTEINDKVGLPKQTVHRLCATLVEQGFLAYEPSGKRLRPARRLRLMGSGILYASRLHIARRQVLEDVAGRVGETVNFVVPAEDGMSYLDRVETDWPFRVQLPIGTHVPFHCTASGKCFLSSMSPILRDKTLMGLSLEKRTENTITTPDKLREELASIAERGYAIDDQEFMDGMVAIAVPIFDRRGRFLAALAAHGPTLRLDADLLVSHKPLLTEAAGRLSKILIDD